jgi:hypothetical protein
MNRWTALCGMVGMLLLAQGCDTPCGQFQAAANRCGQSFNQTQCNNDISSCSNDDLRTMENAASCTENDSVCKNGAVVDTGKWLACVLPVASVSSNCSGAWAH